MTAQIIDGKAIAQQVRHDLQQKVAALSATGVTPGLAVVLVGDDPASHIYVKSKTRACQEVGIAHFDHRLPADTSHAHLLALIKTLNADRSVHGILVQLPLPAQIQSQEILQAIDPAKDVDGFHPMNLGALLSGNPRLVPCTPLGSLHLIKMYCPSLAGLTAVVVGRSTIVGKPMAQLLLAEDATVTIAHSKTKDLGSVVKTADIVVAAVGRPQLIRGEWIKPGAVVIDVGINRVNDRIVGDVEFDAACQHARAITPVPKGVGPMTIAMLLSNTVRAAV